MNLCIEIGRLTNKPELRYTTSNIATTKFTIAVKRNMPNKEGNYDSDFISCVAYNKTAELISKYLDKGSQIAIKGRIQTGNYEKDGKKIYTTDVVVDEMHFLDTKKREENKEVSDAEVIKKAMSDDPFKEFGQQIKIQDESLPF